MEKKPYVSPACQRLTLPVKEDIMLFSDTEMDVGSLFGTPEILD